MVFAFFGYNESYGGDAGLPAFRKQLDDWITHTLAQKYNGKTAPRIVLFSPIAHEDLRNPDLPDGKENNARLEMYTLAMSQVAAARGVRFVDLFAPTRALFAAVKTPLTANGVHLNEEGNRRLAEIIDRDLFGAPPRAYRAQLPDGAAARRRRQELPVVQPLSHHRRLRHLRRSRLPDLHPRQPAQRQPGEREKQGRRAADQLRGAAARGRGARSHDRQPRPADLAHRPRPRTEPGGGEGRRLGYAAIHRRGHQRAWQGAERRAHLSRRRRKPSRR